MKISRTTDPDVIRGVWCSERLWDSLMDDFPLSREDFIPGIIPGQLEWLEMVDEDRTVGILMMMRKNAITWELHVGFHPDVWGTGIPRKFGKKIIESAFELTGAKKLIAMIPVESEPVWKFAKFCGMKIEGTAKKAWQKNGVIMDAYYLGVYK